MPDAENTRPVLEVAHLAKAYGPVRALKDVGLRLERGEVRALLGKNGAGKSTLVKLISGAERPDTGTIRVSGEEVRWSGPAAAQEGGISVVHQELSLVPGLSVAENICLGRWPRRGAARALIDAKAVERTALRALRLVGEQIPLWREAGRLSLAEQQLVEIAKGVVHDPRVLILDEPTSSLNAHEADALLALVRRLAATGVAIVYVSHRMQEIPRVADSVTVLRDGAEVATLSIGEASPSRVADLITGDVRSNRERRPSAARRATSSPPLLSVRDLTKPHLLNGVSFDIHEGEVLGIAGLLGSGRSEILESIFGARRDVLGEVSFRGRKITGRNPSRMLSLGVGMSSEDRRNAGIVPMLSVFENLLLSARGRILPKVWVRPARERRMVAEQIETLAIATSSPQKPIVNLSGGNQQKVVIGRLLASNLKVLLLDEPTRGVDLHAKQQLYELIREFARSGVAIVFVSSELEELPEVCDRVLVLRGGRIVDEVPGEDAAPEKLLALAMSGESK
ncbi:sugar ABC transporter ATP-binding protein [Embleya scabrispora]|uniref:sugar ABC transporter ATP-binding protein n=1 Tax=Embleya scabrispora TaxID=159449 RepID=UPI0003A61917|nr:sugar ABC transporter ATP-binding protein [Embleya scabrispora]MYS86572.1 ATP-binding cassette domain-containing protein [Streptomyces sp. SID5474]